MNWHNSLADLNPKYAHTSWSWLAYPDSLTAFLRNKASNEKLIISVLSQKWCTPFLTERLVDQTEDSTNLDKHLSKYLERKIIMTVMNQPWLFARSLFNYNALQYFGDRLVNLGNNSLGDMIANYNINRTKFEFSYVNYNDKLYSEISDCLSVNDYNLEDNNILSKKLIIRRSLYYLVNNNDSNIEHGKTILFDLEEVFLPALINKMLNLEIDVV